MHATDDTKSSVDGVNTLTHPLGHPKVALDSETIEHAEEIIASEHEFTPAEFKRLRRKIDFIILPMLMMIYGLGCSDKASLASGVIFGLSSDTHLVGNQYGDLTTATLIFKSFGFSSEGVLLWSLPLFACIWVVVILSGLIVHYWPRTRFPVAIIMQLFTLFGLLFSVLATSADKWTKWGVFLFTYFYQVSNGSCFIIYCAGNIIGSQIFRPKDTPKYLMGMIICAVMVGINALSFVGWWCYYLAENKRRDRIQHEAGLTDEQRDHANRLAGETDTTDRENINFRYIC